MPSQLDPKLFCNKEYLLNDLNQCLSFVEELKTKAAIVQNCYENDIDKIPDDVRQWLEKREALQEKVQKILINAKEEWRSVLPIVPGLMSDCLNILEKSRPREPIFDITLDFLRSLSWCINLKRLNRYWPTEVQWLPKVTEWLEAYLIQYSPSEDFSPTTVLVLWLSSAVKTPFDLKRFDQSESKPIAQRISEIIDKNIDNYSLYPVIHFLVGSYYSRSDCCERLSEFLPKLFENLQTSTINSKICSLRILATLLKSVDRLIMLKHVHQIVPRTMETLDENHEQSVKLSMKICGRSALVHLKPSEQFKWRYRCGKRVTKLMSLANGSTNASMTGDQDVDNNENDIKMDTELPDYFEDLIDILLTNLVHKSTIVRFSVAKYLASIGNRLPFSYSDQMLEHVFELCQPTQDDHCWQGSCLAIAEFVRRGYVRIDSMSRVVSILDRALFFEQIKGSFSSGANVRDSACYICWSIARAYDGQLIAQYVSHLAPILLNVACFDREVNCRRAASAVIQELAGRTQKFPNWIDVIHRTEFHELSQIEHCYMDIGAHFAIEYPEFRTAIIENLLFQKCIHWDHSIRRLASSTVGKISNRCSFFKQPYFEEFLKGFSDLNQLDLNHQHGRIIAVSCLLNQDPSLQTDEANLMEKFYQLFVERSATLQSSSVSFQTNLIRESLLIFVEKCMHLLKKDQAKFDTVYTFLLDSLRSNEKNELIQSKTIDALLSFMQQVNDRPASVKHRYLSGLIEHIPKSDHFVVSTLARFFLHYSPSLEMIVEKILPQFNEYFDEWFDQEIRRPETIADVACALLALCANNNFQKFDPKLQTKVHDNMLKCLDDHSITKKGDTGLPVRRATIESIHLYVEQVCWARLLQIIKLIASEAASHRNRTFLSSMAQLSKIFAMISQRQQYLNDLGQLKSARISLEPSLVEDLDLYRECVGLLEQRELIPDLWRGFVLVLADPILEKYFKLLLDYLKSSNNQQMILKQFKQLAFERAKCQRLSIPCLISGHQILTQLSTTSEFQNDMAKFAWSACERTSNPRKYLLACDIFCALLSLGNISLSWTYLYVLLGHRLPRVRTYTATQLFASILTLDMDVHDIGDDDDHDLYPETNIEKIGQILQQTDWSDLDEAKTERKQIADLIKSLIF